MRGRRAGALAADRPQLWLAGAVSELLTLGWLPLALAVVSLPSLADLGFTAASVVGAPRFPVLALAIAALALGAILLVRLLRAVGDAVVFGSIASGSRARVRADESRGLAADAGLVWALQLIAAAPAVAAFVVLVIWAAAVAPAEWQSPDTGGLTFVPRLLAALSVPIALLAVALLAGQAAAAATTRRAMTGSGFRESLRGALADLRRRPAAIVAVTLAAAGTRLVYLAASFALLRTMWRPVEIELAGGELLGIPAMPLLLGFVFVWLCLALGSGALHAWLAAWWSAELHGRGLPGHTAERRRSTWKQRPSSS